jgi:peptide/nickel transport system permease protein
MGGLTLNYLIRRLGIFLLTVWLAATIIFFIPRLAPGDPIAGMISRLTAQAGFIEGADQMIEAWRERFGLDDPLHIQYLNYLGSIVTFDFGFSLSNFPTTVGEIIGRALPWTIGLLSIATVITFVFGNFLGAILAWRRTPGLVKAIIPFTMLFTSVPSILAALLLLYIFVFQFNLFPARGSYATGLDPGLNWEFIGSVIEHGFLPALAVIIVSFGFWTLGMRGMMVTIEGEDYMILARAKGLRPFYTLYRYMVRNAILPQVTALALSFGTLISGSVLVESVFGYRGTGTVIVRAIREQDFTTIQGTSFVLILTTALAVLIIDLIYPLIDPRISFEGR